MVAWTTPTMKGIEGYQIRTARATKLVIEVFIVTVPICQSCDEIKAVVVAHERNHGLMISIRLP